MEKTAKIYVAGHQGLVGSAIVHTLGNHGYNHIITQPPQLLDLRKQEDVIHFFNSERPEFVFLAAAKVGGILANATHPAEFIYDNLMIETNIIHCAYKFGVKKLLFLGSSCIYPKVCPQPIKEEYLLTGPLEQTNEPYAIAKIAGLKMCTSYNRQYQTNFIAAMPTNLYGPGDNFDSNASHVIPGIMAKMHQAKLLNKETVTLWGSGRPRREFLFVDDLAEALLFMMRHYNESEHINIGHGTDITIFELAYLIKEIVAYPGNILWDNDKPDGTYQKLLDVSKLARLGWKATTSLHEGLKKTYDWYLLQTNCNMQSETVHINKHV